MQDESENNTPMLTPVLTPRSSLSRSLLSFSFRSARPLSPLVTGTSTPQEERRESPGKKLRSEYYGEDCLGYCTGIDRGITIYLKTKDSTNFTLYSSKFQKQKFTLISF